MQRTYFEDMPRFAIVNVSVPAGTSGALGYTSSVSVSNPLGIIPDGMLAVKLTSTGLGIVVDIGSITASSLKLHFTRSTSFGEHSQTIGLVYFTA